MAGAITNARILTPDESIEPGTLIFDGDGRITAFGSGLEPPHGSEVTDVHGLTLVPGFIDVHVHGGGGYSLATDDPNEVRSYARWVVSHGVTSFLPTICAGGLKQGLEFVRAAAEAAGPIDGGANVLGVNLEGPFVNSRRRGALPPEWVTPPDMLTFDGLTEAAGNQLKLLTLAPELPHATDVLRKALERRVAVAIGHTGVGYEAAYKAFTAGASHVTHAFNAMRPLHHRDPGVIGAALKSPDVTVEVIADGVHLHRATVQLLVRAFGPARTVLVTDAVTPAGLRRGTFRIGGEEASLRGDRVLLRDGKLAGGAATMDLVVRNTVDWGAAALAEAVSMASTVPARVIGLSERKGRIAAGYDADIVALDGDLSVAMTWVGGRLVYRRA